MAPGKRRRPTLYDALGKGTEPSNIFCAKSDLIGPEARVETFFVNRLLEELGYRDPEIRTKDTVEALLIPKGRRTENYRPDYVLATGKKPRVVIDAKATTEDVDDWIDQCSGYSLALNRRFSGDKPVRYFVITNGMVTKVFPWDEDKPVLTLAFEDFEEGNSKWADLRQLLGAKAARKGWSGSRPLPSRAELVLLRKADIEEVKRLFLKCHWLIWKTEKKGKQSAFFEFSKLMFVKTAEDRRLHRDPDVSPLIEKGEPIPADKIHFSRRWIESLEKTHENPIDALLFQKLMGQLEDLVSRGVKKRIFEPGEKILLSPGVIKEIVSRLERIDLWGIDEDLNGRLFETFLGATMRGEELGQYFTPRTLVKFITRLAKPRAKPSHTDLVMDACCGTGGFLIETLSEMRQQVRSNHSITQDQREEMLARISDETIYGIEVADGPPLARIARLNMYLHGDGGSRIYWTDALDKNVSPPASASAEEKKNTAELRGLILDKKQLFDLALTNPPFSMDYSEANSQEAGILARYEIGAAGKSGTSKRAASLRSGVMFFERYYDLLKPGGRLVTVIDDSILAGKQFRSVRDWIRQRYIVRAVISFPGDAFQRSGARAKTSALYLVKKEKDSEAQPNVFMAEAQALGVDDLPPTSRRSRVKAAREAADKEMADLLARFRDFTDGKASETGVAPERIKDRMDVKSCLPRSDDLERLWRRRGVRIEPLEDLVSRVWVPESPRANPEKRYVTLTVSYDGIPARKIWQGRLGKEITYDELMRLEPGLLAVSHINAARGSIGIIPGDFGETFVSPEYTVLKADSKKVEPTYLWAYLRSPEARARMLSDATGMGRTRVDWEILRRLPVPLIDEKKQEVIGKLYDDYLAGLRSATKSEASATEQINAALDLNNEWAVGRLKSAKPPR